MSPQKITAAPGLGGGWAVNSAATVSVSGASGVIGVSVIGVRGVAKRKGHGCTLLLAGGVNGVSFVSVSGVSGSGVAKKKEKVAYAVFLAIPVA